MRLKKKPIRMALLFFLFMVTAISCFVFVPTVPASPPLLKQSIIEYNLKYYEKSLSDGSYRGDEGILLLGPEVARSLGLKAVVDNDYIAAKALDRKAGSLFSKAVQAMGVPQNETSALGHAKRVGELALARHKALRAAREHLLTYRSRLSPKVDDRLNQDLCSTLLEKLLERSLKDASYNLRDGLGRFYNQCQGFPKNSAPLRPVNVKFVNYVFREFTTKASEEVKKQFDLDKQKDWWSTPGASWKDLEKAGSSLSISILELLFRLREKADYKVDPLLFIALMRRESNFDPDAVSYVGAAGLTQIMPKTANHLGMKGIYMPPYFEEAVSLMGRERKLRRRAIALISEISEKEMLKQAELACELMLESIACRSKRSKLFARYRTELLKKTGDDRLKPQEAVIYGYRYFSDMMKMQRGDISLALASYNAGPHRVKEYNGIPPYAETVTFRNRVLEYYRGYLRRQNR